MARIRTIKPGFFRHFDLYTAERETGLPLRVAFAGLWTAADREGRFKWRPAELKLDCLPFDAVPFERVLESLAVFGFVARYAVDGRQYGYIPSWQKHQVINQREARSVIPPPPDGSHVPAHAGENIPDSLRREVFERDGNKCVRCKASADLTVDHVFPRSVGGTHALSNLRTLCRSCNSARPVAGDALIGDLERDGLTMADKERMCAHVPAHGEGEGKGIGRGMDDGARVRASSSPFLRSTDYERLRRTHAYVGARLRVPNVLHDECATKLGGDNPGGALLAWYAGLDEELELSKDPIPDVFAYLRPRFVAWAQSRHTDDALAKWVAEG